MFNPPATVAQLRAFEREIGLTLPENFFRYLTELGDGGWGPDYGIWSLDKIRERNPNAAACSRLTPLIGSGMPDEEWCAFAEKYEDVYCCDTSQEEKQAEEMERQLIAGGIFISTPGCTMDTLLMCKGPAAGSVVCIDFEYVPYMRRAPSGGYRFEHWMLNGLNRKTAYYRNHVGIECIREFPTRGHGMPELDQMLIDLYRKQMTEQGITLPDSALHDALARKFEDDSFIMWAAVRKWETVTAHMSVPADKKQVVAVCEFSASEKDGKKTGLISLYTDPEFRKNALGRRLAGFALRSARSDGCIAVKPVAPDSGFYAKHGIPLQSNLI